MSVPKTAVHENHLHSTAENEIRTTRQIFAVEAIPKSLRVQQSAHPQLRSSVFTFHRLHYSPPYRHGFHSSPSDRSEVRLLHHFATSANTGFSHRFHVPMLQLKIDIIDFFIPSAKAFVKRA
jgi:hypothetical protein